VGRVRPRLSAGEREQIMIGTAHGESIRSIAARLGRAPSTIMGEIHANGRCREAPGRYRALHRFGANRGGWDARSGYSARIAQKRSEDRSRRPKTGKLGRCEVLRAEVQALLAKKYSPGQIAGVLASTFPDRPEMQVSHETIYKALYVQGRGELRRELTKCLRTGRALRKPRKRTGAEDGRGRIPGMVNISERPAEADDRAVPGHWEGDLIIGKDQASQIGTLVERSTGYVRLLHLPDTRTADVVADAMIAAISDLPATLRRTVTWDQGHEMTQHARISIEAGVEIYFCDPHSPWQRGSNENTNGLLRQYFPKGTDLSVHSAAHLAYVADELNGRPRKRFNWDNPTNRLNQLLLSAATESTVATKP
jgi:IS30 family transposase